MKSPPVRRIPHLRQWLAAIQVFLIVLVDGCNIGWTCPIIGRLIEENPPFIATKDQISWIASLGNLLRPVGNLLGAIANNYFGSKITLQWTLTFYHLIAGVAAVCATSIEHIYITQIFTGIALGSSYSIFPLYVAEIASDNIRGALNTMISQGFLFGILAGNVMGAFLEPWMYGAIVLALTIMYVITFCFIPDTPYKFIMENKPDKALLSLEWYQEDVNAEEELKKLTRFLESKPKLQIMKLLKELIVCPVNRKVMIILLVAYGLIQLSGVFTVLEYFDMIFVQAKVDVVKPAVLVIILGAFGIPGCWVAMYTTDKFGRTVLLCFSCIVYTVASIVVGINFHLLDSGFDNPNLQWLVIVSGFLYRFSVSVGIVAVPVILVSELLPPNVKNTGTCILNVFSALCAFISNKFFQNMIDGMTYQYTFYTLAVFTLLVGIYTITCIPETKGKTLEEIQDMLAKGVKDSKKIKETDSSKFYITKV